MRIEKLPEETQLDYHKRIIYGKLTDKTLSDADYTELSELAYGQRYSSDVARRMFYGSKRTLDLIESERLSHIYDKKTVSEIDAKINELKKERQKFFDQRREYNKIISSKGRQEHLEDVLITAADNLSTTVGNVYPDNYPIIPCSKENEAVLVFGDWHYGMITDNIFNSYNTEICKKRVAEVVSEAISKILLHHCNTVHIVILGDLFHGAIHTSARVASEELTCEQIMQVSEILAQSVENISGCVDNVYVYTTYGNHGRTVQNKNDNIHKDNMERIIPWWLEQRLKNNPKIKELNRGDGEFLFINACGHNLCAVHGDLDNVKSPLGLAGLFRKKRNIDIEYVLLGDKHHRESFEQLGITATICGALCGTDDYANDKRLYSTPSQLLLIVNKERGVDTECVLRCSC